LQQPTDAYKNFLQMVSQQWNL